MAKRLHLKLEDNPDDSSGNGYHFTAVDNPSYEAGKINRAITFGSANTTKFLKRTSGIGLSNNNPITFMAWVKSLGTPTGGYYSAIGLIKVGTASTDDWHNIAYGDKGSGLQEIATNRYLNGVHTTRYFTRITQTLATGTWYHLAYTWEPSSGGGIAKLYLDGQLLSTSETTDSYNVTGGDILNIGVWSEGGGPTYNSHARFSIDEVKVFDEALTQGQIRGEMLASKSNMFLVF